MSTSAAIVDETIVTIVGPQPTRYQAPQSEAPGSKARGVIYTHGKITPMFRMLYANAEYGDITRTSPEARLVKTWTGAVAVSPPRRNTSTSPTLPSLAASR